MRFSRHVGLTCVVLGLFCTGCGLLPVRVERIVPPTELLQDCPAPSGPIKTNRDLAQRALDLKQALAMCNADKEALRKWAEQ